MKPYTEETYGERIAPVYDTLYSGYDPAALQLLVELARGGKALELGIGTGRIAIPLSQAGVTVHGIDVSHSMVAKLREKPGGEDIAVMMGNFADVPVDGEYSLVYVVFNTFYSLLTQEEQVRCFQNVARHLSPEGVFVIEAFVPDMARFVANQAIRATSIEEDEIHLDVSRVEREKQVVTSQHVHLTSEGTRLYPVKIRYVWPSEMDLMAHVAQLQLRERWSDWKRARFTGESTMHVSVYEHQK